MKVFLSLFYYMSYYFHFVAYIIGYFEQMFRFLFNFKCENFGHKTYHLSCWVGMTAYHTVIWLCMCHRLYMFDRVMYVLPGYVTYSSKDKVVFSVRTFNNRYRNYTGYIHVFILAIILESHLFWSFNETKKIDLPILN